jgi:glycosyltransferase involved in cell wall biosynthesis
MSVSVVMPVFNGEPYLEAAIESVLCQSLEPFEFVIVEDGSTDGSNRIIRSYARTHANIVLVEQENRGISAARNRGLERASHDLIAVMDADDVMMPTRLERQLTFLGQNPEVTVVCSYAHLINSAGRVVGASRPEFPPPERILVEPLKFFSFTNSSAMMRKKDVISAGGYREEFPYGEDQDLWGRLLARGCRFAAQSEFLMLHRVHSSSISMRSMARMNLLCELIYTNLARAMRGQDELSLEEFAAIKAARPPFRKAWEQAEFLWQSQYKKSSRAFAEGRWYEFLPRICAAFALRPVRTVKRVFDRRAHGNY